MFDLVPGSQAPKFGPVDLGPSEGGENRSPGRRQLLDPILRRFPCVRPREVCRGIGAIGLQVLLGSNLSWRMKGRSKTLKEYNGYQWIMCILCVSYVYFMCMKKLSFI